MAILTLRPTGDYSNSAWSSSNGDNQANLYAVVDEESANDSDYIYDSVANSQIYFNWGNHSSETGVITDVIFYYRGQLPPNGGTTRLAMPNGSYVSADLAFASTFTNYHVHYATNPATSNAWTWDDIDGITAGFYVYYGVDKTSYQISQAYIEVVYTEASGRAQILVTI